MDNNKHQGQQVQQDPKRNPQGTDQDKDKGQNQQRQGQHDMPKPGKSRDDNETSDKTDRGGRGEKHPDRT